MPEISVYRRFLRIICEQDHGQWSAWFASLPQVAAGGEFPAEAIDELLVLFEGLFVETEICSSDPATRDGHLEFLIPLAELRRLPVPSVN